MSNNKKSKVIIGGIIKHTNGCYGFKTSFTTPELANQYKDMLRWIIKDDGHPLDYQTAYHDLEEYTE